MLNKLAFYIERVTGSCLLVFTGLLFIQVILRYFFKSPLSWIEELTRYIFVWTMLLSLFSTSVNRKELQIDIISDLNIQLSVKRILILLSNFLVVFALIVITWNSLLFSFRADQFTPILSLPYKTLYIAIPLSALLLLVERIRIILQEWSFETKRAEEL